MTTKRPFDLLRRRDAGGSCATCGIGLRPLGIDTSGWDHVVALAGNPNTGKSTVFNALTGLRQHVGNWPGKTVARAEGGFEYGGSRFKLVDLPGTYSLLSASTDEEIARDFILFGRPDCTAIVVDATVLERNLNLILQVLEITDRAVVCLNLMDEARRKGIRIDHERLGADLGVPVVPAVARTGDGMPELIETIATVASGQVETQPHRIQAAGRVADAVDELAGLIQRTFPRLPNARWVAMRLLEGDRRVERAIQRGELTELYAGVGGGESSARRQPVGAEVASP